MIRNKLKSRRGASLSMALLVFLVCALASSVVLVAATASAGRLSNLAKMDQRYYAVNSAADLIRTVIEQNPTVTVVDTSVITRTTTIKYGETEPTVTKVKSGTSNPSQFYVAVVPTGGASGGAGASDPSGGTDASDPSGGTPGGADVSDSARNVTNDPRYTSLLTVVAKSLAAVEETEAEKEAKDTTGSGTTGEGTTGEGTTGEDSPEGTELNPGELVKLGTFTFVPKDTGVGGSGGASTELTPQQSALQVEICQMFQTNGTLTYYISKIVESAASGAASTEPGTGETTGEGGASETNLPQEYTLKMIFEADIRHNTVTHTDYGVPQLITKDGKKDKQTVDKETITTTTTYTWHLTDVVKSRVPTTSDEDGSGSSGG